MSETLRFGYNAGLPAGVTTAWGARAIITQQGDVDLLPDRQSVIGEPEAVDALLRALNGGILATCTGLASRMLRDGVMSTRRAREFLLYADEAVTVKANTNASHGYLYVVAYPSPSGEPPEYVTKTGRVLTESDIYHLAAEAEAGYDLDQLRPRTPGTGTDEGSAR